MNSKYKRYLYSFYSNILDLTASIISIICIIFWAIPFVLIMTHKFAQQKLKKWAKKNKLKKD